MATLLNSFPFLLPPPSSLPHPPWVDPLICRIIVLACSFRFINFNQSRRWRRWLSIDSIFRPLRGNAALVSPIHLAESNRNFPPIARFEIGTLLKIFLAVFSERFKPSFQLDSFVIIFNLRRRREETDQFARRNPAAIKQQSRPKPQQKLNFSTRTLLKKLPATTWIDWLVNQMNLKVSFHQLRKRNGPRRRWFMRRHIAQLFRFDGQRCTSAGNRR